MTTKERDKLRKLQDRLLSTNMVQVFVETYGRHWPFWDGGPTYEQLRSFLYPDWEDHIREAIEIS